MLHRVTRKTVVRSQTHDNGRQVFEEGDEFEPTEAELNAFSDRLEPVEVFSKDQWLDASYEDRLSAVTSGEVDDHLDEIIACETSTQVEDAAEERQMEFGTAYSDDESDEESDDEDE